MYCPVYVCNSDSKMTNEVCFFDFQVESHQVSNTEERHRLNSASTKHSIHCETLECLLFITPEDFAISTVLLLSLLAFKFDS